MSRAKATFFLPTNDNDGRSLAQEIVELESALYVHFSGWTLQGLVQGSFKMKDGSWANDMCRAYFLVFEESEIPTLERILLEFKAKTKQEAMYLEVQHEVDMRYLR